MGRSDRDGAGIFNPPCAELVLFRGVEYCMRQSTTSVKTITLEAARLSDLAPRAPDPNNRRRCVSISSFNSGSAQRETSRPSRCL